MSDQEPGCRDFSNKELVEMLNATDAFIFRDLVRKGLTREQALRIMGVR